jgi:predicted metal-binding protein
VGLFLISIVLSACAALAGLDGPASPPAAVAAVSPSPSNPFVEPARDVLAHAMCGNCHRPGLPTSNARALKIFNLHDPVWYAAMTDEQLRSLKSRVEGNSKIEEGDQNQVIAFVNCKLDGACTPAPAKESP